jgi:hypothetical protein
MALVALYGTPVHCNLAALLFSPMNSIPHHRFPFSNKVANTMIVCEMHVHSFAYSPSRGVIYKLVPHAFKGIFSVSCIATFFGQKSSCHDL